MSEMEKILERSQEKKEKGIYCKKCDVWFPDRKEWGKHLAAVHQKRGPKVKTHYIPNSFIPETQYLSNGAHMRLEIVGRYDREKGIEVFSFKYL